MGILAALFVIAIVVSAASAANLNFRNENFSIDVPSGSNFTESAVTNVNIGDVAMKMLVFENLGNNSNDVSTIIYLKDSSADKNVISEFINDLKKDNEVVEENSNYTIVKTKNSDSVNFFNFDVGNDIGGFIDGVGDVFSSHKDINFSAEGNSFSISDAGLEISDANGEGVSIRSEGIKVSDSTNNGTEGANVTVDGNFTTEIQDCDYTVYLKNPSGDQLLTISGNKLDTLKAMANTASFK